jgi:transposase
MSKTFRPWKIDEPLLLPARVADFVDERHLARFVLSLVHEELDLAEITGTYGSERGQPPFHPVMMTALLLYAYCSGIYSSRRIAKACGERVDVMSIVGLDAPDFRTISDFRKRHLKALKDLFKQVLLLCETAGLVKLGHVSFDGSKVKANASKHKAMSYGRMAERAAELDAEVAGWLSAAEAADAEEDKLHGRDKSGEEMPDWVADKQRRAEKIRAAKAELEAEAKAAAEAELQERAEAEAKREAEGRCKGGRPAAPPSTEPDAKAQKNFTDPESRIMKSKDGFVQAYNVQIAVDAEAQIIVAHDVTQSAVDCAQLLPMTDAVAANLGRKPEQVSADAGYCSQDNLAGLEDRNIDAYVATGRARDAVAGTVKDKPTPAREKIGPPTRIEAMRAKIKAGGHASPYRLRKQLPEPVFGQIKQARGFRQFLLRGFDTVRAEWALVCTAHNLLKLAHRRNLSAALPRAAGAA